MPTATRSHMRDYPIEFRPDDLRGLLERRVVDRLHRATGSIAATSVCPSRASRTTTLQGSMVPTLFSNRSASCAKVFRP